MRVDEVRKGRDLPAIQNAFQGENRGGEGGEASLLCFLTPGLSYDYYGGP